MEFIIRPAKAGDAESIGNLAAEFIEYLRSLGEESAQKFDTAVYCGGQNVNVLGGLCAEQRRDSIL